LSYNYKRHEELKKKKKRKKKQKQKGRRNLLERLEEKKNIQGKKLCKPKRIIKKTCMKDSVIKRIRKNYKNKKNKNCLKG
jgi:hypothetical protein